MKTATRTAIGILAALGIGTVAAIDYFTGTEIRVFPLYFLPLMLVAWFFSRTSALLTALLVTALWAITMYLGGRAYSEPYIWAVNFIMQALMFIVVALLAASVRNALRRERKLARTDALTGLANSRSFFERAGSVLAMCHRDMQPATLAYIDLDNFKQANDALGHEKGDALLKKVAHVLNENLRASDIAARIGGDEFVVLLPESDQESAKVALEKVRAKLARTEDFQSNDVTASIGAVAFDAAPRDINRMIKAADKVMYRVKAANKNHVIVQGMDAA